jgi:hypothetical protein
MMQQQLLLGRIHQFRRAPLLANMDAFKELICDTLAYLVEHTPEAKK